MTPAELNLWARAVYQRDRETQELTQVNLYSLAALVRVAIGAKTMPCYASFFSEKGKQRKEQPAMTDRQMYDMAVSLNKLFGGKEE